MFDRICGNAGAQRTAPVCRRWREGFSPSGGRKEGVVVRRIIVVLSRFILFNENLAYNNPFFLFPWRSLRLCVLCVKNLRVIAPKAPAISFSAPPHVDFFFHCSLLIPPCCLPFRFLLLYKSENLQKQVVSSVCKQGRYKRQ